MCFLFLKWIQLTSYKENMLWVYQHLWCYVSLWKMWNDVLVWNGNVCGCSLITVLISTCKCKRRTNLDIKCQSSGITFIKFLNTRKISNQKVIFNKYGILIWRFWSMVWFIVFNATFNNISVISWRSVLLVDQTGVPGENHQPVVSHRQT